ncbi:hypothetical protein K439DRAFT_1346280 [Ramaria rubella]|nr:hypothetical protein K439DRAFT_1346280 [Ramaria rubella]
MNNHILETTGYSPRELLLGIVIEEQRLEGPEVVTPSSAGDIAVHMVFVDSMHADAFHGSVTHATAHKARFNKRVAEIIFKPQDLIQVYHSKLDGTFETENKLLCRWSLPMRIRERFTNSYSMETLEGLALQGLIHTHRLCCFIPRCTTELACLEHQAKNTAGTDDAPDTG